MRNILFCLDFYYPHIGGGEVLFTNLAEGLAKHGCKVTVVTQKFKNTPSREIHNGVEIHRVKSFGSRYIFAILCLPILWKLAGKADLIHATTFASTLPAWLIAKLRRRKLVLTVHEVWVGIWDQVSDASPIANFINDKIERFIYRFNYQNYVAVSNATAKALARINIPIDKITVIHNGVDYQFWDPNKVNHQEKRNELGIGDNEFLFVFSGRPGFSKGLPDLIKALGFVRETQPNVRLLAIVSNAKAVQKGYQKVIKLIQKLNLDDYVILLEPVPRKQLPSYIAAADTVVVPSLSEGFGFAAAEACALNRPVIVTDNASLPEVVSGKVLFAKPSNHKSLALAMIKAVNDEFEHIPKRQFLLQDNIKKHLDHYDEILDEP